MLVAIRKVVAFTQKVIGLPVCRGDTYYMGVALCGPVTITSNG